MTDTLTAAQAKAVNEAAQSAWHEMKSVLADRDAEIKKLGGEVGETTATLERVEKALEDRLDQLETKSNRPGGLGASDDDVQATLAKSALEAYFRKGDAAMTPEFAKALATDTDFDGGYLVPENIAPAILEKLVIYSPLRSLCNIETINKGSSLKMPTEAGAFSAAWVAERAARVETASGTVGLEEIPVHEMYAKPLATQQMLEDTGYDIEGWIARKVGEQMGVLEAAAFVTGDGVGKPEGVLNGGLTSRTSAGAGAVTADDILDLLFDLPEAYAQNGVLVWNRSTTRVLRKQKAAGTGEYLWAPGIDANTAPTFAGHGYREAIDMPVVASGAIAAVFADWKRLYTIVDRKGINTLRDPFTTKPFVEFYTTKRVGGQVVLPEAGRILTVQ